MRGAALKQKRRRVAPRCAWHPDAASRMELLSDPSCFVLRVKDFICQSANSFAVINRGAAAGGCLGGSSAPSTGGRGWLRVFLLHFPAAVIGTAAYPSGGTGPPLIFLAWCYMSWGMSLYRREFATNLSQMCLSGLTRFRSTRLCFCHISCELDEIGSQECLI